MTKPHDKSHEKWKKVAEESQFQAELDEMNAAQEDIAGAAAPEEMAEQFASDRSKPASKEEALANEYREKVLRLQADFENKLRRMERDVTNAHKYALDKFIDALLPVIDSLERGLGSKAQPQTDAGMTQALYEGMELTHKLFLDVLKKFGVQPVDPMGQPFNPHHHEAVSVQPNTNNPTDTVLAVLQKGYLLNDRLVRPALVVVAK